MGDLWKCLNLGDPENASADLAVLAPSRDIVRKMLGELHRAGKHWEALNAYAQRQRTDRRVHPRPGEARNYLVQQSGKMLFTRVPVDVLGVTRGMVLTVRFTPTSIVIQKPTG